MILLILLVLEKTTTVVPETQTQIVNATQGAVVFFGDENTGPLETPTQVV